MWEVLVTLEREGGKEGGMDVQMAYSSLLAFSMWFTA